MFGFLLSGILWFGILCFLVPVEVQEFGLLLEDKNAVEHIAQKADRDGGDGTGEVIVDVTFLQQPNTETVTEPAHYVDHNELEQPAFVFIVENQFAVGCEIEQDADNVAD